MAFISVSCDQRIESNRMNLFAGFGGTDGQAKKASRRLRRGLSRIAQGTARCFCPCDLMRELEYETSLSLTTFTSSSPMTRSNCIVRISRSGPREWECSLSKLQSECPGFAPVGPCGAMPEDHHGQKSREIDPEVNLQHLNELFNFENL